MRGPRGDVVFVNLFAANQTPALAVADLLAPHRRGVGRLARRPLLAMLCEATNAWTPIAHTADRLGYDAYRAGYDTEGQREIVALVHPRAEVIDVLRVPAAAGLDTRIAPDRWALAVLCELRRSGRRFSGIVTHWHARLQDEEGGVTSEPGSAQRVHQAMDQTDIVLELAARCRDRGFPPIIAADANMRATPNAPAFAPSKAFPHARIVWDSIVVDGIGHDVRAFDATPVVDFLVTGTDHRGGRAGIRTTIEFRKERHQ